MFRETVFLTGFPGFIAERLVKKLAKPDVKFYLLVQKTFLERAAAAVLEIAEETGVSAANFAVVTGDITLENLGLREENYEKIIGETTSVYHLAAVYDLAVEKDLAFRVNVEGTKNVNDFVKKVEKLKRYNYVSTCYIAGKREGLILETELTHDAGFRNFYEETKYLAETSVEDLKSELPTTIFRPSVVVGDSRTGETAKYDGIYYLIQYLRKFPALLRLINVGNNEVKLNLVPVDFVVDGIAALAADERAIGKTIALADPHPLTTEELFDVIAFTLTGKKSILSPPEKLMEKALLMPVTPPISGLPHSAVPYFYISQTYDTSTASELLKKYGISCPKFPDYVANLVKFVEAHPQI